MAILWTASAISQGNRWLDRPTALAAAIQASQNDALLMVGFKMCLSKFETLWRVFIDTMLPRACEYRIGQGGDWRS